MAGAAPTGQNGGFDVKFVVLVLFVAEGRGGARARLPRRCRLLRCGGGLLRAMQRPPLRRRLLLQRLVLCSQTAQDALLLRQLLLHVPRPGGIRAARSPHLRLLLPQRLCPGMRFLHTAVF